MEEPTTTLFLGNLDPRTTRRLLYEVGIQGGPVKSVTLPLDANNKNRGYGFVEYEDVESAAYAVSLLRGCLRLFDRQVRVSFGGQKGGGGGGGGSSSAQKVAKPDVRTSLSGSSGLQQQQQVQASGTPYHDRDDQQPQQQAMVPSSNGHQQQAAPLGEPVQQPVQHVAHGQYQQQAYAVASAGVQPQQQQVMMMQQQVMMNNMLMQRAIAQQQAAAVQQQQAALYGQGLAGAVPSPLQQYSSPGYGYHAQASANHMQAQYAAQQQHPNW